MDNKSRSKLAATVKFHMWFPNTDTTILFKAEVCSRRSILLPFNSPEDHIINQGYTMIICTTVFNLSLYLESLNYKIPHEIFSLPYYISIYFPRS